MIANRRIAWPLVISCGLFLSTLLGVAGFRLFALGSSLTGNKPGSVEIDGRTRTYFVHLPPSYDGQAPMAAVIVLHGATESPEGVEKLSGMSAKADKEGFIAVYPRGTGRMNPAKMPTWNSGNCCGYAQQNHVDDVSFMRALIDQIEQDYAVDPKRLYVTGISNGAMMSYRLACELSDKIAAAAPVEGAQNVTCRPSSPVSIIVFHGTADRLVPFNGGTTPFQTGPKRDDTSVADAIAFWVKQDVCTATPKHDETPEVHSDVYSGCADGTGVELYAVQGGHHIWPGSPISGNSVPATDLMWAFFSQHSKP